MTTTISCFECGEPMTLVRENSEMRIGGRSAVIEVERYRCSSCGDTYYSPQQMDAAQKTLVAQLRAQERLLSPQEVKAVREKARLTQAQFEQLLGVGPKTVVRWERGTVFQNRATDQLIRLIAAVPGTLEYLAKRNGVTLPSWTTSASVRSGVSNAQESPRMLLPDPERRPARERVTDLLAFRRSQVQTKEVAIEPNGTPVPLIPEREMR